MELSIIILTCAVAYAVWQNWKLKKKYNNFADGAVKEVTKLRNETGFSFDKLGFFRTETESQMKEHNDRLDFLFQKISKVESKFSKPKTKKGKK